MVMQSMQGILTNGLMRTDLVSDSGNSSKKYKADGSFDMFLNNSIEGKSVNTVNANKANVDDNATAQKTVSSSNEKAADEPGLKASSNETDIKTDGKLPVIQSEKDDEIAEGLSIAGQVLAILDLIRNAIMDALDLNADELDRMMNELGLENTDLLDPKSVIQLVLNSNGATDPTAILLDERLGDTFNKLVSKLDDIKNSMRTELSDSDAEKILEWLKQQEELGIGENETPTSNAGPILVKADTALTKEQKTGESEEHEVSLKGNLSEDNPIDSKSLVTSGKNNDTRDSKEENNGLGKPDELEAFIDKLSASYEKNIAGIDNDAVQISNIKEIAQQIVERVHVMAKPGETTMELQLYPEHLGKVNLTISSTEGVISARFVVQNEMAKEALESQLITLRDALDQQGIKVEHIEVTITSYSFEQEGRSSEDNDDTRQKKSGNIHKITFDEAVAMSEEPVAEEAAIHVGTSGYNIDYTA